MITPLSQASPRTESKEKRTTVPLRKNVHNHAEREMERDREGICGMSTRCLVTPLSQACPGTKGEEERPITH